MTVLVSVEEEPPVIIEDPENGDILISFDVSPVITVAGGLVPDVLTTYDGSGIGPTGAGSFDHHQASPSSTWIINHNLGRKVEPVVVLDADLTRPVYPDVVFSDVDNTTIVFPDPASGFAYFN